MQSQKLTVAIFLGAVIAFFALGVYTYQQRNQSAQADTLAQEASRLVRPTSTVLGPVNAPVTIVEFFDPACETCRAFYPLVKDLMRQHPSDIRLVMRYAPFHQGSDHVVKLLEAAKVQDKYVPVLEMLLATQPQWVENHQPKLELAYQAAAQAGLDVPKAQKDAQSPAIQALLAQDLDDIVALKVTKTPTFFVNGRALPSFGAEQLQELVAQELAKIKR